MNFSVVKNLGQAAAKFGSEHLPDILTAVGVVSYLGAVATAIKNSPEAQRRLEKLNEADLDLTTKEKAKVIVTDILPLYAPTASLAVAGTISVIGANRVSAKRLAGMATLYAIKDETSRLYEEKVRERLGEADCKELNDGMAEDLANLAVEKRTPDADANLLGVGDTVVYDGVTGFKFRSSLDKIKAAQGVLCSELLDECDCSVSDFYYHLELPELASCLTDQLGWTPAHRPDISFSAKLDSDGVPIVAIYYNVVPLQGTLLGGRI